MQQVPPDDFVNHTLGFSMGRLNHPGLRPRIAWLPSLHVIRSQKLSAESSPASSDLSMFKCHVSYLGVAESSFSFEHIDCRIARALLGVNYGLGLAVRFLVSDAAFNYRSICRARFN